MTLPQEELMSPALRELIAQALIRLDPPRTSPTPAPVEGQSRREWLHSITLARTQADAAALAALTLQQEWQGQEPAHEQVRRGWHLVPVPGGEIVVRSYRPPTADPQSPLPAVALVHGGAFWMGGGAAGFQMNDGVCRQLCAEAGVIVVNIDHRLAPEHPFPTPVQDVLAAVEWLTRSPDDLVVDPERIIGYGISSGGNLMAIAADRLGRTDHPLRGQILQNPSLDLSRASSRFAADPETVAGARTIVAMYAGPEPDERAISPLLAEQVGHLPPTMVVVATHDHLADSARNYARRLDEAAVDCILMERPMTHVLGLPADHWEVRDAIIARVRELAHD